MALPAIADVRRGLPRATIAIAARQSVAPLFGMVPGIDEVITLADGVEKGVETNPSFETAILLPNSFRAAVIARRAGIPDRWGYRTGWRGLLLTRAVDRAPAGIHQVEYYQHLVHALGFPRGPSEPRLDVSPDLRAAARRALEQAGWDGRAPLVVLAPGAAHGGAKRWAPASFAEVADGLAVDGVQSVLIGSAMDARVGMRHRICAQRLNDGHESDRPDRPCHARRCSRHGPRPGHERLRRDASRGCDRHADHGSVRTDR